MCRRRERENEGTDHFATLVDVVTNEHFTMLTPSELLSELVLVDEFETVTRVLGTDLVCHNDIALHVVRSGS